MAHPLEHDQLGSGDRTGGGSATADVDERIVGAVHDERRNGKRPERPRSCRRTRRSQRAAGRRRRDRWRGRRRVPVRHRRSASSSSNPGEPMTRTIDTVRSIASSRVAAGGDSSAANARCVACPTDGSPVLDMIEVSDRTRSRMFDRGGLGDHPAHRRADEVRAVQPERVEQPDGVGGHVRQPVGRRRRCRRAAPPGRRARAHPSGGSTGRCRGCRTG